MSLASADVLPGATLAGRYLIDSRLGEGGYGEVFLARQMPLGREVAIKVLQSSRVLSQEAYARFMREASLAQRLEHPNTVRLYDVGTTPTGLPFIVYERLRGRTLAEHLAHVGPMPRADIELVTAQILKALMEAHELGIIHRDIKPANIFVTSHPGEPLFVRVLDFGIAKDESAKNDPSPTALTAAGQTIGTIRYMAPEQLAGETVGPGADVYSVGLLVAEMVTGVPVFPDDVSMTTLVERVSPSAKAPLTRGVLASPLYPIIARATASSLQDRYPSSSAMLADLQALSRTTSPSGARPTAFATTSHAASTAPTSLGMAVVPIPSAGVSVPLKAPKRRSYMPFILLGIAGFIVAASALAWVFRPKKQSGPVKRAASVSASITAAISAPFVTTSTVASLRSRRVGPPNEADIQRRLKEAGFAFGGLLRGGGHQQMAYRYVEVEKHDCRGVANFAEYDSAEIVVTLGESLRSGSPDQVWIGTGRFTLSTVCSCAATRAGQLCSIELADVLTR